MLEVDGKVIRSARTLASALTLRFDRLCRVTLAMIAVDARKSVAEPTGQAQTADNGKIHQAQDLFAKVISETCVELSLQEQLTFKTFDAIRISLQIQNKQN